MPCGAIYWDGFLAYSASSFSTTALLSVDRFGIGVEGEAAAQAAQAMAIRAADLRARGADAIGDGEKCREVAGDRGVESAQLLGICHGNLLTHLSGGWGGCEMGGTP